MKYAHEIIDITNAFKNSPLMKNELEDFYCEGTMEFRTGDKYSSPIEDICEACQTPSDNNAFLLLGHKGCGKSTELNKMSMELSNKGYHVSNVQCGMDLDLINPLYTDLLILMGEALLKIADNIQCDMTEETRYQISSFWSSEIEEHRIITDSEALSIEAGLQAGTPKFFQNILQVFAKIKADLKYNEENRKIYRLRIIQRSSEWLTMMNQIAVEITNKLEGKQPILIFEDLDKINPSNAWEVFSNYSVVLTGVSFPIIYTFPIALSYDPRFSALEAYFKPKTLPVIKQKTIDGKPYEEGIKAIIEIVEKRADLNLFEADVLETLIKKTGGSLRDLFYVINTSAQRAIRRKSDTIALEDIQKALEDLKTSLTRRIERKHFEFLLDICKGNKQIIENKEMLLEMLQANTVLEYNGKRWHDVHPLVVDFLEEQKLVQA